MVYALIVTNRITVQSFFTRVFWISVQLRSVFIILGLIMTDLIIWWNKHGDRFRAQIGMVLKRQLQDIRSKEAVDVFQKSKVKWAIEGDENSKAFLNHFAVRFKKLTAVGPKINFIFPKRLAHDQATDLERNISRDEIRTAVWNCEDNKSPGPDGFTFEFFKKYWGLIGPIFVWRFVSQDGSLWSQVIQAIYEPKIDSHSVHNTSNWCSILREMHTLKAKGFDFMSYYSKRTGNGNNTNFWLDIWKGDSPLCEMFPLMYALELEKQITVANKLAMQMDSSFRRTVRGGIELSQFNDLVSLIGSISLSSSSDRWVCNASEDGIFRVKDIQNFMDDLFFPSSPEPTRWIAIRVKLVCPIELESLATWDGARSHGEANIPILQILWGIVHSANLDFATLIWDEFEWQAVDRSTKPSKMSKLLYTCFTKLIIDYFLSCKKNIPRRSDSELHSEGDDSSLTKLSNTVKGNYKFRMKIPDTMINDAFKQSARYKYYKAKKAKAFEEPEEQYVRKDDMPRKTRSLTVAEETIAVELAKSISIDEQRTQQRQRSQLTIDRQIENDVAYTYTEWGQKHPAVQSLLDLRKGSKANRLESLRQKKQLVTGEGSNTSEESAKESNDADDSNIDLTDDEPKGDDDTATYEDLLDETPVNELTDLMSNPVYTDAHTTSMVHNPKRNPEVMQKAKKNMRKINFKKAVAQKFKEYDQKLEALTNFNVSEAFKRAVKTRPNPKWYTKTGSAGATKRRMTWFDLLLKSNINQNENHILGPSTAAIAKKLKALIQKDELTITYFEGAGLEKLKQQYTNDVELKYHEDNRIDFFKAEMSNRSEWKVYSDLRIKSVVRIVTDNDVVKSNEMVKKIDQTLKRREQLRRLEEYVGGRLKTVNPHTFSKKNFQSSSTMVIPFQDSCLRQEILEYMEVHDNDASESSQPSWGKMCTLMLSGQLPGESSVYYFTYIEVVIFGVVGFFLYKIPLCTLMTKIEDCSSYITVLESAQDMDVGLGEADSETLPKRCKNTLVPKFSWSRDQRVKAVARKGGQRGDHAILVAKKGDYGACKLLGDIREFWATATVHHHAIRFKMDNKKHIVNLESFKDMLHICPRVPAIRTLTDININKLHQPWRSFAAINKCLTRKSSGYDSLRLSQAQILWGLYHKWNVDYAYLMWEDFVYQVEHKDHKKSNEMYYPRFTKVIIHHFMPKDPSIPRRNKVNWHYVRDDHMLSTIKLISRHQNKHQFGALLPIELTSEDIRNSNAYKEYYAVATGAAPPKPKASVRKTRSSSDTTITPPTAAAGPRLTTSTKGKQAAKASKANSLSALSEVAMTEAQQLKLVTKRSLQQTH
nr:hypothetical protein [Tanacetum cinerariifolium]